MIQLLEGNRMGCPGREEVEEFFAHVLEKTGAKTEMKWSPADPSICLESVIYLRESLLNGYRWSAAEEVIHEFAHLNGNKGHGVNFYRCFVDLAEEFLA